MNETSREFQELCFITAKRNELQVVRNRVRHQYRRYAQAYIYVRLLAKHKRYVKYLSQVSDNDKSYITRMYYTPEPKVPDVSKKLLNMKAFDLKIKTKELDIAREQAELQLHYHSKATTKRVRQLVKALGNVTLCYDTSSFVSIREGDYKTGSYKWYNRNDIWSYARSYEFDNYLEQTLTEEEVPF